MQKLVDTKDPQRLLYHDEKGEMEDYTPITVSASQYGPEEYDIEGEFERKYQFPLIGINLIDETGEKYAGRAGYPYPPINVGGYTQSLGYDPKKDQYYYSIMDEYDFAGDYAEKYSHELLRDRPDIINWMKHKMKYGDEETKKEFQTEIDKTIADYNKKDYLVRLLEATGESYGMYERHYYPKDVWSEYLEYFNVEQK